MLYIQLKKLNHENYKQKNASWRFDHNRRAISSTKTRVLETSSANDFHGLSTAHGDHLANEISLSHAGC